MSASGDSGLTGGLRNLTGYVVATIEGTLPFIVAAAVLTVGSSSIGGLFGLTSIQTAALFAVAVTLAWIVVRSQSELSLPFMLTLAAILVGVYQFVLPAVIRNAFNPVFRALGLQPGAIDAVQFIVLAVAGTLVYWAVRARMDKTTATSVSKELFGSGRGEKKGAVTKLVEDYVTIGRMLVTFVLTGVFFATTQGGEVARIAGEFVGESPLVFSNLASGILGFFGAGGSLPAPLAGVPGLPALAGWFGSLSPLALFLATLLLTAGAYAAKEQIEESRAKLGRARAKKRQYKRQKEELEDE